MSQPAIESAAVDERELAARVAALSLEQKVRLLTGADFWSLHPERAAGLRRVVVSDGPAGARGERWDERDTSATVAVAVGASSHLGRGSRGGSRTVVGLRCATEGRRRPARPHGPSETASGISA